MLPTPEGTTICWPLVYAMHVAVVTVMPVPHVTEHCEAAPRTHRYVTHAGCEQGAVVLEQLAQAVIPAEATAVCWPLLYAMQVAVVVVVPEPHVTEH